VVSLTDHLPAWAGNGREVVVVGDKELAKAHIHLTVVSKVMDAVIGILDRLHVWAAGALVYEAWPEIRGDMEELVKDVFTLLQKIRALQ
jgi:hypothetical protein